jgi:3-dehydroquinate synthetase
MSTLMSTLTQHPVKLQLNGILYHYQGSALICMVHQMISWDDATISKGLTEFYKHGMLTDDDIKSVLEYIADELNYI